MRRIMLSVVVLVALAVNSFGENMQEYLQKTQELARSGKHKEALERYLWFHDHALEHDRGMYGVRLSFALSYWLELGKVYPEAKTALLEMRDKKTKLLEDGKGERDLFHDVAAINHELGQNDGTVKLFRKLDADNGVLALKCWDAAKDAVFEGKQIDLVKKYIKLPIVEYDRLKERHDLNVSMYKDEKVGGERFKQWSEKHFVKESLKLIKAAEAIGDKEAAQEIRKKAVAVVDDPSLREVGEEAKDAK